ncbi:mixed lineage protein kinase [Holotrichia oblita]|uniref:Mixed lineage protein kinase n=1 Tax=Holotrichia oblita TaxID=644536 RepID=A0ACB9T3N8_HOLOL|nr:mixed lineage protein kinase [Holotrichia oblita]
MSANNYEYTNSNTQVAGRHSTLLEIISENTSETSLRENSNILKKPVRLSAFFRELKEAENEPIPDIKYSSSNEIPNEDEVDNVKDEQLSEVDDVDLSRHSEIESQEDKSKVLELDTSNKSNVALDVKWLITPAKSLQFNSFVTPHAQNFRTDFRGSYTQIPDKSSFRIQHGGSTVKNSNTLNAIPYSTSWKKALFFPQSKQITEVIYESLTDIEDKENIDKQEDESLQRVLCSIPVEKPTLDPFEKIVVNNIEYVILEQIGRGGSSVVFHCYNIVEKVERAIKRVNLTGDKACIDGYINEVKMLYKLQKCDRIIRMYSYEIRKKESILLMVIEKGEKDLARILKELSTNTEHLPMYMLIYYWMEMLYAVKQIHDNGIIHSDLKPSNFLMVSSKLKLIDFGIASSLQNDMTSVVKNVQIGSLNYISPEALLNNNQENEVAKYKINYKSDVWSLGCILYQLVFRKTPFQHIGHSFAKLSVIVDPKHEIEYPKLDWVPQNIVNTLKMCLQYDVKLRPAVCDLIKNFEDMYY